MNRIKIFSTVILLSFVYISNAQNWCKTDEYNQQKYELLSEQERLEHEELLERIRSSYGSQDRDVCLPYVLPVVCHVIYNTEQGNISLEQIQDGINVLNEDFRRYNSDTSETRDLFKPHAGVADFEFRLAQLDTAGNPTDGVVRIESSLAVNADDGVKALSHWPQDEYFNIWIVQTIESSGTAGTILGYAEFPTWGMGNTYGVVIRNDRVGRIGTGTGDRTLTHEIGHCMGLYHTFQSSCGWNCDNSGDDVCDTPPVDESTQGCDEQQNTCSNDTQGNSPYSLDVVDQLENYMSYDACQNMFTQGQVDRMFSVIGNVTELQDLCDPDNLANAGVDQLNSADFTSNIRYLCGSGNIHYTDLSQYGETSWNWTFDGGDPASSSDEFPVVFYDTPGLYDVDLSVSNSTVTQNELKSDYIMVSNILGNYPPISESFEDYTALSNNNWISLNYQNDAAMFQISSQAAYTGSKCVKMGNYGSEAGNIDELVSSSVDLSPLASVNMTFKAAYAQNPNTSSNDKLRVYISNDCGYTWSIRMSLTGSNLATASATQSEFIPADASEWEEYTVASISANYLVENFMYKFVFESDSGNNMYIDDINITGTWDSKPELYLPINGETNAFTTTTIDWKSVDGVSLYKWELDTTDQFSSALLQTGTRTYIDATPNNSDTEQELNNLIVGQKYYWRVQTITGVNVSNWSDIWEFTVSSDGSGIDQKTLESIHVYPNPNNGSFIIKGNNVEGKVITIYDLLGKIVYQKKAISSINNIDASDWNKGVYIVEVGSSRQKVIVH